MLVCTRKDLNSARGCLKILIALWHIFKDILMIPMTLHHQYDQLQRWYLCAALQVGAQDLVAVGVVHPMIVVEEVVSLGTEILDQVKSSVFVPAYSLSVCSVSASPLFHDKKVALHQILKALNQPYW